MINGANWALKSNDSLVVGLSNDLLGSALTELLMQVIHDVLKAQSPKSEHFQ